MVNIDGLYATLRPNPKFEDANKAKASHAFLAADEQRWQLAGSEEGSAEEKKAQGLFVQKIVDNLQIHIHNIHIRFEDSLTSQSKDGRPAEDSKTFAVGLTLDQIDIASAVRNSDGVWEERFVDNPPQLLNKLIRLGKQALGNSGFGFYCDEFGSGGEPLPEPGSAAWVAEMKRLILHGGGEGATHGYILEPIVVEVKLSKDKNDGRGFDGSELMVEEHGDRVVKGIAQRTVMNQQCKDGLWRYAPLNEAAAVLQNLKLTLDKHAVQHLARLGQWTGDVRRTKTYLKHRPSAAEAKERLREHVEQHGEAGIPPGEQDRRTELEQASSAYVVGQWWHFAMACVHIENKHDRYVVDFAACQKGSADRRMYIPLYERRSGQLQGSDWVRALTEGEQTVLQALEGAYPIVVIQTWRRIAWKALHTETERRKAAEPVRGLGTAFPCPSKTLPLPLCFHCIRGLL